jgi:hypothetical protein
LNNKNLEEAKVLAAGPLETYHARPTYECPYDLSIRIQNPWADFDFGPVRE